MVAGVPLAAAIATLPVTYAAGIAAVTVAAVFLALMPAASTAALAFAVPFGDNFRVPVGGLALGGVEVALAASAAIWWARSCVRHDFGVFWHPVWGALALVCLAVIASMPDAVALDLTVKELAKWLSFAVALALGMSLAREPRAAVVVTVAILAAGSLEALRGLNQAISGAGPLGFLLGGGYLRSFGSFGQPNPFAAYLTTGVMLATGLLFAHSRNGLRGLVQPLPLIALTAGGVMTLGVLASLSRGALLALLAGVAVMAFTYRPRTLLAAPLLVIGASAVWLLGGFGILPEFLATRVATIFDSLTLLDPREVHLTGANFAVVQRMAIWEAAQGMFADNPLLGVGAGNFDRAYPAYALPNWPQAPGHAHNLYLNLLAEMGLVGLLSYLTLLATLLGGTVNAARSAIRAATQSHPESALPAGLTLAAVGLVAVLAVHHLFDNLYVHGIGAQLGLLFGLALGAGRAWGSENLAETPAH